MDGLPVVQFGPFLQLHHPVRVHLWHQERRHYLAVLCLLYLLVLLGNQQTLVHKFCLFLLEVQEAQLRHGALRCL